MHALRTAILEHTTSTGIHHDWLIEDPTLPDPKAPDARLWTARVGPPPQDWPRLKRFDLTVIPPHRRLYLHYQGEVSGNRGRVKRVAEGHCFARRWSTGRIVLSIAIKDVQSELEIIRQSQNRWIASKISTII